MNLSISYDYYRDTIYCNSDNQNISINTRNTNSIH